MHIRRLVVIRDTVHAEAGLPALRPVTRAAACAVIANPLAGRAQDDIGELIPYGELLGGLLVREALALLSRPPVAYGKAALVGVDGEIEHGAAVIHPRMGAPVREAIGGGKALMPSNVKVAAAGGSIDVPLGDRNDPWLFDHLDTFSVVLPDAPRPREMLIVLVLSDGGRPRPRLPKGPGAAGGAV
jgi:hypothetical protein